MTKLILTGCLNLLMVLFLAPLFEGIVRKYVKARIAHSRQGPPVIQPFYDLLKLLGKEDLEPSGSLIFKWAPLICFAVTLVVALLVPMGTAAPLEAASDLIVFIYLVGIGAIAMILAAMASISPYAYTGASREMMIYLIVEPVLIISLIAAAINCGSLKFAEMINWHLFNAPSLSMLLAGIALLVALQAQFAKVPFDIPEAEQEVIGGPFIEISGPKLALFKWAIWARQFIFASIFCSIFIPWPQLASLPLNILVHISKVFGVFVIVGLLEVVNPRIKIDQALAFYFGTIFIALGALILAYVAS
jgi:formate hydrogenlyase subunit 4